MKYHGKFESPRKGRRLTKVAALSLALVLLVSAGGTLAYLFTSTDPVENTFSPAKMEISVVEKFENNVKSSVQIQNDSEAPVYIRVAVVSNFVKADEVTVCAEHSAADFSFTHDSGEWEKKDGYYYYTKVVGTAAADKITDNLLKESITVTEHSVCCKQQVSILAQAIQAEPSTAVTEAWGFVPGSN